jgi:hypothetical protein
MNGFRRFGDTCLLLTCNLVGEYRRFGEHAVSCKVGGFHGGDYEEWCLLGCYAVWLL